MGNRVINTTKVSIPDDHHPVTYEISLFENTVIPRIRKAVDTSPRLGCPMIYDVTQDGIMYDICTGAGARLVGPDPDFRYVAAYVNKKAIDQFYAKYNEARHLVPVDLNPGDKSDNGAASLGTAERNSV